MQISEERQGRFISQLDTAVGMLIVAAIKDKTVEKAMRLVGDVSFQLGNLDMEEEDEY